MNHVSSLNHLLSILSRPRPDDSCTEKARQVRDLHSFQRAEDFSANKRLRVGIFSVFQEFRNELRRNGQDVNFSYFSSVSLAERKREQTIKTERKDNILQPEKHHEAGDLLHQVSLYHYDIIDSYQQRRTYG